MLKLLIISFSNLLVVKWPLFKSVSSSSSSSMSELKFEFFLFFAVFFVFFLFFEVNAEFVPSCSYASPTPNSEFDKNEKLVLGLCWVL